MALYACTLPPTERLAGAGRAQLLVVWSCEITPYCKAFWRCLRKIVDCRLQVADCRLLKLNLKSAMCNMQCRFGHYFKGAPPEGVTGGSSWQPAALLRQAAFMLERSTSYICPPFIRSRLCGCPVPAMGDQPIDSGRRGHVAQDPFRLSVWLYCATSACGSYVALVARE